ncbi:hypothetical protein GDO86_001773 [Hymenochirus boettgeri]|uniref:DNA oxidative demethylase ALKBH2 n=1 Tax=Hymenochirus boettgeri TaxID=247094 RepID=A0A8T2KG09_9PIPI|nr:hypothetical protein GDO86_001773 [Hymenochirus boettgeri]
MDKFVIKKATIKSKISPVDERTESEEISSLEEMLIKKSKTELNNVCPLADCFTWKKIQSKGLDCDYILLFSKREADDFFQQLETDIVYFSGDLNRVKVYGKWHNIPRKQVTYGDEGLTYTFSGITLSPKPWNAVLDCIRNKITSATGMSFNFVLINRYKDGNDHIGEHRDDERELVPHSAIASVSFGACRDFLFRHRDARCKNPVCSIKPVKMELQHGSLLVMNYPTNVYWYHSLPVRKKVLSPRINLTFRNICL